MRHLAMMLIVCTAFAQEPAAELSGEAFKTWLRTNYYKGRFVQLGYDEARIKLFNFVDNHNGKIRDVYGGFEKELPFGGTENNPLPIKVEHTVPQSLYGGGEPMRSDLYHLFPAYITWKSVRGKRPFLEVPDDKVVRWMVGSTVEDRVPRGNIQLYSKQSKRGFEPREDHKGNVARSVFYFFTMYPDYELPRDWDINLFYAWHLADPVDEAERARNDAVARFQGNRNPFVDRGEWVLRAWPEIDLDAANQILVKMDVRIDARTLKPDQGGKTLLLVKEQKLSELLSEEGGVFEASGVYYHDDTIYVVSDNRKDVAAIHKDSWSQGGTGGLARNGLIKKVAKGFEGITYDRSDETWYMILEADKRGDAAHARLEGRLFSYRLVAEDRRFEERDGDWLDFSFQESNKGFEGLCYLERAGGSYLLALCEGNDCEGEKTGVRGNGRIKVFERRGNKWRYEASIALPGSLNFEDYSGMDLRGDRLAVVSQASSGLWIGRLAEADWSIDGIGQVYTFPIDAGGQVVYCNVEGVAWMDDALIVVVSDQMKQGRQSDRCGEKDQSVHIFKIPD